MESAPGTPVAALETVTHARLRAAQGDVDGARTLLTAILARTPGDREAEALLQSLRGAAPSRTASDFDEGEAEPALAADAQALAATFRAALGGDRALGPGDTRRRLERWLRHLAERRRRPDVR